MSLCHGRNTFFIDSVRNPGLGNAGTHIYLGFYVWLILYLGFYLTDFVSNVHVAFTYQFYDLAKWCRWLIIRRGQSLSVLKCFITRLRHFPQVFFSRFCNFGRKSKLFKVYCRPNRGYMSWVSKNTGLKHYHGFLQLSYKGVFIILAAIHLTVHSVILQWKNCSIFNIKTIYMRLFKAI